MCALAGLQKCEVAQRPRAANRAEHRSTPHLRQLNIRKRPCRWCTPSETDRNEAGKRCFYRDCSQERPGAELGSFPGSALIEEVLSNPEYRQNANNMKSRAAKDNG